MAPIVLTDTRLFAGAADLTSVSNKVEVPVELDAQDATTFAAGGWKAVKAGLASAPITASGFWEAGDASLVDDATWAALGAQKPWTVCPVGADVGDLAYLVKAVGTKYTLLGAVGEMAPWEAETASAWPIVRGLVAHPPGTARTATGDGTAQQLGAITAGHHLYAALHVLSVSDTTSPSLTVTIESDSASDFASPTTQITFDAATALGSQITRAAGPITDTQFRPSWTISGVGASFLFVVSFGVK